jgi:hypothetical protein
MQVADVQDGAAVDPPIVVSRGGARDVPPACAGHRCPWSCCEIGSIPFGAQALTDADELP